MTDNNIEQAIEAFNNIPGEDVATLKELNARVQAHMGRWGEHKGGERLPSGAIAEWWVQSDSLIYEFIDFMHDKGLLPVFNWTGDDEISKLFASEDPAKYDDVDLETVLKLVYVATRKERFASGTLAWAFETGGFTKLVDRLASLKAA